MDIQLIALDLDDTLLRDDLSISDRTLEVLLEAQREGVRIVLASGRPTGGILRYARELDLSRHGGWIVSYNGGAIVDCATGRTLFEKALPRDRVHEIHDLATGLGAGILSYVDNRIVTPKASRWTDIERTLTGMEVVEVPDFKASIVNDPIKAIVVDEPKRLAEIAEILRPKVEDRMSMVLSKPFFLEFTDLGIDKGETLGRLLSHLGIGRDAAMAVGDGNNDLSMIRYAGLGVAMANASELVREAADHVTASNRDDGVALAVERFVLDNRRI